MAGAYCRYCDRRCFVDRVVPDGPHKGWHGHMATCPSGMEHDRNALGGYDSSNSINPVTDPGAAILVAITPGTTIQADVPGTLAGRAIIHTITLTLDRAPWAHDPERGTVVVYDPARSGPDVVNVDSIRVVPTPTAPPSVLQVLRWVAGQDTRPRTQDVNRAERDGLITHTQPGYYHSGAYEVTAAGRTALGG